MGRAFDDLRDTLAAWWTVKLVTPSLAGARVADRRAHRGAAAAPRDPALAGSARVPPGAAVGIGAADSGIMGRVRTDAIVERVSCWRDKAGRSSWRDGNGRSFLAAGRVRGDLRQTAERIAGAVRWHATRLATRARYAGREVTCPCCGGRFRGFIPQPWGADGICPKCGAYERHRALWLWLRDYSGLLDAPIRVLHCAPEPVIQGCLQDISSVDYESVDLESPHAELHADLTDLPLADDRFDLVIVSHVLEHIADEGAALSEIRRVLRSAGRAVVLVPVDRGLEATLEDDSVRTPEARLAVYGQADHVRLYGRDLVARLTAAGFEVAERNLWRELDAQTATRYGLVEHDSLFICSPAGS